MSDTRYVLDASVVLAVLFREPVAEATYDLLQAASIGAVNLSEVVAKLQDRGLADAKIDESLAVLNLQFVAFDQNDAIRAGALRNATRHLGLSLGDRACLALAMAEGAIAVTMDRSWAALDLPVEVRVARPISPAR